MRNLTPAILIAVYLLLAAGYLMDLAQESEPLLGSLFQSDDDDPLIQIRNQLRQMLHGQIKLALCIGLVGPVVLIALTLPQFLPGLIEGWDEPLWFGLGFAFLAYLAGTRLGFDPCATALEHWQLLLVFGLLTLYCIDYQPMVIAEEEG